MTEREKGEESGIKVVDKRRFTAAGDLRADAPPDVPVQPKPVIQGRGPDPRAPANDKAEPARRGAPAASKSSVDFMSFVASLATNAMAALGLLPEAQARGMPVNPQLAREYIDIVVMLQERTQGNLSREEEAALTRLLSELRHHFVEATTGGAAPGRSPGGAPGPRLPGMPAGMPGSRPRPR